MSGEPQEEPIILSISRGTRCFARPQILMEAMIMNLLWTIGCPSTEESVSMTQTGDGALGEIFIYTAAPMAVLIFLFLLQEDSMRVWRQDAPLSAFTDNLLATGNLL